MDTDIEDDEIIEEIPVYLSKALSDSLYVIQFPTKTMQHNFNNSNVANSCIKPFSQQIKMDFSLNTGSKYYDAFKGEQFAVAADGKQVIKGEKPSFSSGTMDKQSYMSTKPLEKINKYIVGILQDKEIHATQLHGIVQMRPVFSYFDKLDKRNKAEEKAENEADLEDDELKQVTVKFARTENDKVKKAREKSFNYLVKKTNEEPWCETMWYKKYSQQSELERQKLFSIKNDSIGHTLSLNKAEYLNSLIPCIKTDENIAKLYDTKYISKNKLKSMSLIDQIQHLLKDVRVVTIDELIYLLDDENITVEKVIRILPQVGLLINGNWVAQSEILYPVNTVSGINGVPAELMCRGRDYILYQLTRNNMIDRPKITQIIQLPTEEVKEILLTICKLNESKCWELLKPMDMLFMKKYPELMTRQDIFWKSKESIFNELEMEKTKVKRVRKKSFREGK